MCVCACVCIGIHMVEAYSRPVKPRRRAETPVPHRQARHIEELTHVSPWWFKSEILRGQLPTGWLLSRSPTKEFTELTRPYNLPNEKPAVEQILIASY